VKRRTLLLSGLGTAGAMIVGWAALPPRSRIGRATTLPHLDGEIGLNGWIRIASEDGHVQLAMPRSEMGQGAHTGLAMLVAEELDIALARVQLVPAGHDSLYGNVVAFIGVLPLHPSHSEPGRETAGVRASRWMVSKLARELGINVTGGSSSIADLWHPLRLAAATARGQLLGAAALKWRLPIDELQVRDGVISHPSGPSGHFGEFAHLAAAAPASRIQLKRPEQWTVIGRPAPRLDVAAKSDGSARFGIDVRLPGMLYAVVRHAPAIDGGIGRVDSDAATAQEGVLRVVRLPSYAGSTAALAVVGRTTWHARRGADALDVEWHGRAAGPLSSKAIMVELERQARAAADAQGGCAFHSQGDAQQAIDASTHKLEAVYRAPYLAHATMEPINCTARMADGKVEVWAPTQVPGLARALAAQVAGVPQDNVTVHVTYLGGGFGRRLEVDFVGQAVRVAMETGGAPVQLVWPREEDLTHDFYRPAGVAVMRAAFDDRGNPSALSITSAGDAIAPRWLERAVPALSTSIDLPDKTASEGLFDLPYAIANQRIAHRATTMGVPVGSWRSVGHSQNAFFSECFIDEMAHASRQDPVAFRLSLLRDMPRHAAVLRLAAEQAGWRTPLPTGRARGVALHESFGSIVAQVAEVSLDRAAPRVHRVVCAIDCGIVVNPRLVAQQMESGIVFGLTAALWGGVDIEDSVVRQRNFPDHPLLTLAQTPRIETHIVPSGDAPGGVGEPGTPPIAPAVANALFALTGNRLRELPLKP
jgi:isoquinoline 1-oxidoreductase beta subunit